MYNAFMLKQTPLPGGRNTTKSAGEPEQTPKSILDCIALNAGAHNVKHHCTAVPLEHWIAMHYTAIHFSPLGCSMRMHWTLDNKLDTEIEIPLHNSVTGKRTGCTMQQCQVLRAAATTHVKNHTITIALDHNTFQLLSCIMGMQ